MSRKEYLRYEPIAKHIAGLAQRAIHREKPLIALVHWEELSDAAKIAWVITAKNITHGHAFQKCVAVTVMNWEKRGLL